MQHRIKVIGLVLSMLVFGCGGKLGQENMQESKDVITIEPFYVEFGEQGGFTGEYSGYAIDASGEVVGKMRLPGRKVEETPLGMLSRENIETLRSTIESIGFYRIEYSKRGNMTYSIKIKEGNTEHRVYWPAGDKDAPETLKQLRQDLLSLVKSIQK